MCSVRPLQSIVHSLLVLTYTIGTYVHYSRYYLYVRTYHTPFSPTPQRTKKEDLCAKSVPKFYISSAVFNPSCNDVNNDNERSATIKTSITNDDNVESVHDNDDYEAEELPKETYVMEITRKAKEIDGDGVSKKPKVLTSKQRKQVLDKAGVGFDDSSDNEQ